MMPSQCLNAAKQRGPTMLDTATSSGLVLAAVRCIDPVRWRYLVNELTELSMGALQCTPAALIPF
jgi:hypothetical protein